MSLGRCLQRLGAGIVLLITATQTGLAADWKIRSGESAIRVSAVSSDVTVRGGFEEFDGSIAFDPGSATGQVRIQVKIASLVLVNPGNTKRAQQAPWFDSATFPAAVFKADAFKKQSTGNYTADGELTIRDVTMPLTLPFQLSVNGGEARMTGAVELARRDFGLGLASPMEDSAVAPLVRVEIELVADRL